MEKSVIQRIMKVMDVYDISVTSLSKKINVAQTTLNRQIQGDGVVSLATICLFLDYFKEISAEWLLRGEGEMIKGKVEFPRKLNAEIEVDNDGILKLRIK